MVFNIINSMDYSIKQTSLSPRIIYEVNATYEGSDYIFDIIEFTYNKCVVYYSSVGSRVIGITADDKFSSAINVIKSFLFKSTH